MYTRTDGLRKAFAAGDDKHRSTTPIPGRAPSRCGAHWPRVAHGYGKVVSPRLPLAKTARSLNTRSV